MREVAVRCAEIERRQTGRHDRKLVVYDQALAGVVILLLAVEPLSGATACGSAIIGAANNRYE